MTLPAFPETNPGDTHQRILNEAAKLFAEKGYARATTRALAAAANVTEVTLFRHFESKEKLFEAVAQQFGGPSVAAFLKSQITGDDYRADLMRVSLLFMQVLQQRGEAVRMMLCEASHFPEIRDTLANNPRTLRTVIARYLEEQIERKRIRPVQPETAAQLFLGMLFSYCVLFEFFNDPVSEKATAEQIVETAVDIFVNGTILRE